MIVDVARKLDRDIDECIAIAKAYEEGLGYAPNPDARFAGSNRLGTETIGC